MANPVNLLVSGLIALPFALSVFAPNPASATQATGRVANGYYWLLTDAGQWQCRSDKTGQIHEHKVCTNAGAVKPKKGQFLR